MTLVEWQAHGPDSGSHSHGGYYHGYVDLRLLDLPV